MASYTAGLLPDSTHSVCLTLTSWVPHLRVVFDFERTSFIPAIRITITGSRPRDDAEAIFREVKQAAADSGNVLGWLGIVRPFHVIVLFALIWVVPMWLALHSWQNRLWLATCTLILVVLFCGIAIHARYTFDTRRHRTLSRFWAACAFGFLILGLGANLLATWLMSTATAPR